MQKQYTWHHIDQMEQPEDFADYLDTVTALSEIQRYKQKTYQLLRARPGAHLLDVGCGVGDDVRALTRLVGAEGLVVGVDNSQILIQAARQRTANGICPVLFRVEDAARLSFADHSFDGCRADRVFMHVPDRRRVLAEMVRVTRPGGWIVANDPDWDTLIINAPDKPLTRTILTAVAHNTPHPWSGRELYQLFLSSGLHHVSIADTATLVLTDFATANRLYGLAERVAEMEQTGKITAVQAHDWLQALQAADQAGTFFSAITGFTVVGQKP